MTEEAHFDRIVKRLISRISRQEIAAFIGSIVAGLAAHGYMFANKMVNHDDMHYGFDLGGGFPSIYDMQRWALPTVSDFSGRWNTPWLIGILCLVLIGVASAFLVQIIEIKSVVLSAVLGVLFVTFPAVTGTLTYMFSADGYFWAIVLIFVAAGLTIKKSLIKSAIACVMLIISLALYQAYIPFFYGILFLYIMRRALLDSVEFKEALGLTIKFGGVSVMALVLYMMLSKYFIITSARMDNIGNFSPDAMLYAVKDSLKNIFVFYFMDDYGVSPRYVVIATVILYCLTIALIICLLLQRKAGKENWVLVVLSGIGLFLSAVLIYFINPGGYIHMLMKYQFVLLPIGCLSVLDIYLDQFMSDIVRIKYMLSPCLMGISVLLLCWNYVIFANNTYYKMQMADNWVYGYSNRLIERVEECDGYTASIPLCFIGSPYIEANNQALSSILWGENRQITGALSADLIMGNAASVYNCYEDYLKEHLGWDHIIYREYDVFGGAIPEAYVIRDELAKYPNENCMTVKDGILYVRFE